MEQNGKFVTIDSQQVQEIVSFLEFCTNSFVFVYDMENDAFSISNEALLDFPFPSSRFSNALHRFRGIVADEDCPVLLRNIDSISAGTPFSRQKVYHLISKSGKTVPVRIRERLVIATGTGGKVLIGCIEPAEQPVFDELTGLESDEQARLDYEKASASGRQLSGFLMQVDIDNFTSFNESEGFETGNRILRVVAEACRRQCTDGTKAYQGAGRKFLLMNLAKGGADSIRRIYSGIKQDIQEAEYASSYAYMFTISAGGIALFKDSSDYNELIKKVTFSLNTAKERGKNNLYLFSAGEYNSHLSEIELENALRASAKKNFEGFRLFYQPVIDAQRMLAQGASGGNACIIGAEALLRWESGTDGLFGADDIIPVLERSSLIVPVGRWVLMTACSQCHEWNKRLPHFHMSINISYVQLKKTNLVMEVQAALEKTHVNPENIILEITESGHIDSSAVQEIIAELAALGVQIDIDDFGTGYSNLRYIQNLHANTLKLDYTFIHKAVTGDGKDQKIIEYITRMAHDLGMTVCMEGIESDDDVRKLGYIQPDKFQGFLFGRPVSADRFEEENLRIK